MNEIYIDTCKQIIHTYYPNMESNEVAHYSDYGIEVLDMCSELSYFIVYDFPQRRKAEYIPIRRPTIVTYKDDNITFEQLRKRYQKFCPAAKNRKNIRFQLSKGYLIPVRSKVIDLKKVLRKDSVDGVVLFTFDGIDQDEGQVQNNDVGFTPECGMMDCINMEDSFDKQKEFSFHFILPGNKFIITLQISPSERVNALLDNFFKQVAQQFGVQLVKEDIKECNIKGTDIKLRFGEIIEKHPKLYDNSEIEVVLVSKEIQFARKGKEQNMITLYKEQPNTGQKTTKSKRLVFEDIRSMSVSKLNSQFFLDKYEKGNKHNPFCLKVMDFIFKGEETLMKLNNALQKLKKIGEVKLVGYFIPEKVIFYKQIPQIVQNVGEFTLEQLNIPHEQIKERDTCERKVNERLQAIKEKYFQDKKHVEPILIYTSNLKYKNKDGKIQKIYVSLNERLRNQSVLQYSTQQIGQFWFYKYTSTLLKHLQNIKGVTGKVYRGVDYDPEAQIGDRMTFKSFTSTSRSDMVSVNFSIQGFQQKKLEGIDNAILVLFQMNILSGKPIDMLSYFNTEAEILLQPFTEFKVIGKKKKTYHQTYEFTVYELREINSDKELPKSINNYILWVDDKPNQGREIFNEFIDQFNHPSVLFQINSTAELQNWIEERKPIINDKNSKIIMVTNMVRVENGEKNFYAGVQSINLIRTVLPDIPIAVYVRDTNASENNLNTRQVDRKNLIVISQFQDLSNFTQEHTSLKFRSLIPQEPINQTEPILTKAHSSPEKQVTKSTMQTKSKKQEKKSSCQIM